MKIKIVLILILVALTGVGVHLSAERNPAYVVQAHPTSSEFKQVQVIPIMGSSYFQAHDPYAPTISTNLWEIKKRHINPRDRRILLKQRVTQLEKQVTQLKRAIVPEKKKLMYLEKELKRLKRDGSWL